MLTRPNLFFLLSNTKLEHPLPAIDSAPWGLRKILTFAEYSIRSDSTIKDWYMQKFKATETTGLATLCCAQTGNINLENWLFVTPTSLAPTNDNLIMHDTGDITGYESKQLLSVLRDHLFDEFDSLITIKPNLWALKTKEHQDLLTVDHKKAVNGSIADHVMKGEDSKKWRRLTSEIEILFSQHNINHQREKERKLPINSIWIWGTGRLPKIKNSNTLISSDRRLACNLAKISQARILNPEITLETIGLKDSPENIIIELNSSLSIENKWNMSFNDNWVLPAHSMLKQRKIQNISLIIENNCNILQLDLNQMSQWKIWRYIYPPNLI